MSRCQHCNKLTHSEHLTVEYSAEDQEKISELTSLEEWRYAVTYRAEKNEYGMLKCGDIYIHFKMKENKE